MWRQPIGFLILGLWKKSMKRRIKGVNRKLGIPLHKWLLE